MITVRHILERYVGKFIIYDYTQIVIEGEKYNNGVIDKQEYVEPLESYWDLDVVALKTAGAEDEFSGHLYGVLELFVRG